MNEALLALGANIGRLDQQFDQAIELLQKAVGVFAVRESRRLRTEPIGTGENGSSFVNSALLIETNLAPRALLDLCLRIELEIGRERPSRWCQRKIDIDLLFFGQQIVDQPELTLPHPRALVRRFALEPSAELAPDYIPPGASRTLSEFLEVMNAAKDRFFVTNCDPDLRREIELQLTKEIGAGWQCQIEVAFSDNPSSAVETKLHFAIEPNLATTKFAHANAMLSKQASEDCIGTLRIPAQDRNWIPREIAAAIHGVIRK